MKSPKTWVIAANGQMARLFDLPRKGASPVPLEDHVWTAPPHAEFSDAQGMTQSRVGPSQHRMAPRTGPDLSEQAFARDIAGKLAAAQRSGQFERLVVAAAPRMLGQLRDQMDNSVQKAIWFEIDKDLTQLPLETFGKALEKHMSG